MNLVIELRSQHVKNLLRGDFLIIVIVNEVKTKIKKAKFIF